MESAFSFRHFARSRGWRLSFCAATAALTLAFPFSLYGQTHVASEPIPAAANQSGSGFIPSRLKPSGGATAPKHVSQSSVLPNGRRSLLKISGQSNPSKPGALAGGTAKPGNSATALSPLKPSIASPIKTEFSSATVKTASTRSTPSTSFRQVAYQQGQTNRLPALENVGGNNQQQPAKNPLPAFNQLELAPPATGQTTDASNAQGVPAGVLVPGQQGGIEGLKGEVSIFINPDTGQTVLVGDPDDTALVRKAFEDLSKQTRRPVADRILLNNISSSEISEVVQEIYDENYLETQGRAFIRPLRSPNGLYVFGTKEAIDTIRAIVEKIDGDAPEFDPQDGPFVSFRLRHISAADAKRRLDSYFGQLSTGNGGGDAAGQIPVDPVTTVADFRSNILIVRGAKQYLEQAGRLIAAIDVDSGSATDVVRVIPLKNALAEEIAVVIQDAVNGQLPNAGLGFNPDPSQQQQTAQQGQADEFSSAIRSARLKLKTITADGREVKGGISFDVRITADRNSNSLIVRGPENTIDLVVELVNQLDKLPGAETLLKVFAIENGDAQSILDTLQALFPGGQNQQGQLGGAAAGNTSSAPLQSASATEGASLVNLRFSIDERTNTIIATGPAGDLRIVEDLINRLDEADQDQRITVVHRLSNSPVLDIQESLDLWLQAQATRNNDDPRTAAGVNFANRSVDVIPEVVSNSLIISALPQYLPTVMEVIEKLDRRPPTVKVKVLIAEVDLDSLEEFGLEVGIQDSLLFDRGTVLTGDAITGGIGFPFNTADVANSNAVNTGQLASQALTNFGTGRVNSTTGTGGLVLSAGSDSINVLLRALQSRNCVRVLSKPHIVTLENLQGRIQVGAQVPRITGTSQSAIGGGVQNSVVDVSVGVILEMTPRVSPDGMIVMFLNATKSALDEGADGVPVAVDAAGNPVLQQPISTTTAQTTIMARSGQTVIFSGLIQESKTYAETGVPILADLPVLGPLFKFESNSSSRSELLIILTPYLVDSEEELDRQNQDERERMHWCLSDVAEIYGTTDYHGYQPGAEAVETIYPDQSFDALPNDSQRSLPPAGGSSLRSIPATNGQNQPAYPLGQSANQRNQQPSNPSEGPVRLAAGIQSFVPPADEVAGSNTKASRQKRWDSFKQKFKFPTKKASFESQN